MTEVNYMKNSFSETLTFEFSDSHVHTFNGRFININFLPTAMSCPQGQIYKFQTWMDQPSCALRQPKPSKLTEGCVCQNGDFLSGKKCVHKSKCGCLHNGFYMEVSR